MRCSASAPAGVMHATSRVTPDQLAAALRGLEMDEFAESVRVGANSVFQRGAPRSMKMGTIRSRWRYDATARHELRSLSLRRPAMLSYALRAAAFPDFAGWSVTVQ